MTFVLPSTFSYFKLFKLFKLLILTHSRFARCPPLAAVTDEQENSRGDIPGPLPVVCSDMIVADEQIARAKLNGAQAVLLQLGLLNEEVREREGGATNISLSFAHFVLTLTPFYH